VAEPFSFGKKIRHYRKAQHLRLAQIAKSGDISLSFLSQIERGQANPSIRFLPK
jgi:transcriptional regulator with XRE-family HTH domain